MKAPKVLLVEDDKFVLKAMKLQFEASGFEVKTAETGDLAFKILKKWTPSAMILDILMPGKDGFEILKTIKNDPLLKGMPIIIASNLSRESDIDKGLKLSAADYIVKSDLSLVDLVQKTLFNINNSIHGQNTLK